ncbi:hypothetical protein BVC80_1479g3 [Macleaya cordata]|uniref:Uncharacterized protein n=1 Tax=Macleaya cordata TaxID=56857 RepID=A0A200PUS6_MACCD|nr:hypothetical protein BVC80_1479g3 [Macleaya cordata]
MASSTPSSDPSAATTPTHQTSTTPTSTDPYPIPNLSTMTHLVSVKLDRTNHLLWKSQMEPLLYSHDLYGFVDPAVLAPPTHILDTTTNVLQPNPIYAQWCKVIINQK